MTSRHTRSNAQGPLHQLTNEELARLERQNRQLPRPTSTNMGDHQDDLTAAFALMQQQMQQMQQTIQANAANQRNAPEEVDQLIKSNQNHVFIMEESPQDKRTIDATSEADQATEDHHEVSYVNGQGWQFKNYHPNPNVRNNPHLFNNPKPDGNTENAQGNQPPVTAPADEEEAELPVKHTPTTTEQPTVVVRPVAEPVPTRDYVPKVPYPVPAKATRKDKEEMKCRKMLEDLTVRLPLMNDPLELALTRAEAEQNVQNIDADGYAKMLDSARTMERLKLMDSGKIERLECPIISEQPLSMANLEIDFVLQMPPRTRNPKALKASRGAATPSHSANVPSSYPWPNKAEGQPININDPLLLGYNCEGWDKESAARYNRLLAAEILPTRFTHAETLAALGLESDVFETLDVMGLAPLCYQAQVLYPDLVRQLLATAQITYQNPTAPTYENCYFSFMADGKFCSISLHDLNELLEIVDTPREGSSLLARLITSKVTNGELQVLYTGLEDEIRRDRVIPIQTVKTNPGFLLITMLSERKDSMVRTEDKKDRCGSVLTPLFKRFNIDLDSYTVVPELEYIDTAYLITCHILRDESTYKFTDKDGITLYCKLPLPGLTDFTTLDNIVFLPNAEHLCVDPRAPIPDENAARDDVEDITPPADGAYDLEDLTDVTDDHAYRQHSLEAASEVRMSRRRKEQGAHAKNQRALQLEKRDFRGTGEQPATPAAAIQTESGDGRRMQRACLKRSCPFGAFCGEHSRRTVPRLFSSRTSRRSDPELDDGIDQQRDHHHDSGVFQLSDPSSRKHCTALE
ncbi:hypothetical protein IGI04_027606 [Brassica rapa subsp. trilocularis]|uniref:Arabidopsis retrotransposon Orf1 C-terminal domain-containing protein n=1 Tax=Brassica rapa subsp. trilocularis TaxID=1813537 RepID=A0ABQ7KZH8_BRACM|nr:hypothetical protein IGI04_027606 [Brassica rapa subsp. trilocularis]